MAKNISLLGADYPGVPAVQLPMTGGGMATFYDMDPVEIIATAGSGVTISDQHCYQFGKIVCVNISVTIGSSDLASQAIIVSGLPPAKTYVPVVGCRNLGGGNSQAIMSAAGNIINNWDGFAAGKKYFFNFVYAAA